MNKALIAIVTAAFAVTTLFTSSAQAGFKGGLAVGLAVGALTVLHHQRRYEHRHWRKKQVYARRPSEKVHVSKKASSKKSNIAKVETKVDTPPVARAENENSSITTAALANEANAAAGTDETATPVADKIADEPADTTKTAKKLDCKKFFPSVGMTLSVPCE